MFVVTSETLTVTGKDQHDQPSEPYEEFTVPIPKLFGQLRERVNTIVKDAMSLTATAKAEPPPVLYHYTSASGLRNIIESASLWTTPAPYLNDQSEIRLGVDLFSSALDDFAATSQDVSVLRRLDLLRAGLGTADHRFTSWLTSFAQHPDQLSQWRGYAVDGYGYAIGFERDEVVRLGPTGWLVPHRIAFPVVYDPEDQRLICRTVIARTIEEASLLAAERPEEITFRQTDDAGGLIADDPQLGWLAFLVGSLKLACTMLKDRGFEEEQEYRFAFTAGPADHFGLAFHERNGVIVPHIALTWRDHFDSDNPFQSDIGPKPLLPIKRIVMGPNLRPAEDAKWSLEQFLRQRGYIDACGDTSVEIAASDIPYLA